MSEKEKDLLRIIYSQPSCFRIIEEFNLWFAIFEKRRTFLTELNEGKAILSSINSDEMTGIIDCLARDQQLMAEFILSNYDWARQIVE